MSNEEACKVTSASKHKERKPKKPHYIPRPWGKPYNYKCFQCPFTCMEKSHLYNHMKYSLCKNSLSLLIESDWPYKKGNVLHPDQLRSFQQMHGLQAAAKDDLEQALQAEDKQEWQRCTEEDGEGRGTHTTEDDEDGCREELTKESPRSREDTSEAVVKKTKPPDSEQLIADMLSLEDRLLRAHSVEVDAQLRHYKIPKSCLTTPRLLPEQWRLLGSGHTKAKAEGAQPQLNGSIPCYPPPPNLVDYQDPTGLNLSVLGMSYPISPSLFSYMNMPAAAQHAGFAQLPFLASAAQLMHPASSAHTDGPLVPPRLCYPFLCEHSFGANQSEVGKSLKTSTNGLEMSPPSGFQQKVGLWKVPALRPGNPVSAASWLSPQRDPPNQSYRLGDKTNSASKESKAVLGLKRTGGTMRSHEAPIEKKASVGFTLDFLKKIHPASSEKCSQNSSQDIQLPGWSSDPCLNDPLTSSNSETASIAEGAGSEGQDLTGSRAPADGEPVAALLTDLSKALHEYQEAERKISSLEKEDIPAQRHLWEHLSKIRSELSHIHQALERTAGQNDGPLDLSVKRDSSEDSCLKASGTEAEEEDDEELEEAEDEEESKKRALLEKRKKSLDLLIKMGQASVVNAETLWPSRTTKCEADSSVLLCPDGRPVLFADIPSSIKPLKRPPSIQQLEAPSPLTAPDS